MSGKGKAQAGLLHADKKLQCCMGKECPGYIPKHVKPRPTRQTVSLIVERNLFCRECNSIFCLKCLTAHSGCERGTAGQYTWEQLQAAAANNSSPTAAQTAVNCNAAAAASQQSEQHTQPRRGRPVKSPAQRQHVAAAAEPEVAAVPKPSRPASGGRRRTASGTKRKQQQQADSDVQQAIPPAMQAAGSQLAAAVKPAAAAVQCGGLCKLMDVGTGAVSIETAPPHSPTIYPHSDEDDFIDWHVEGRLKEQPLFRRRCAICHDYGRSVAALAAAPDGRFGYPESYCLVWSHRRSTSKQQQQQIQQVQDVYGTYGAHLRLYLKAFGGVPTVEQPMHLQQPEQEQRLHQQKHQQHPLGASKRAKKRKQQLQQVQQRKRTKLEDQQQPQTAGLMQQQQQQQEGGPGSGAASAEAAVDGSQQLPSHQRRQHKQQLPSQQQQCSQQELEQSQPQPLPQQQQRCQSKQEHRQEQGSEQEQGHGASLTRQQQRGKRRRQEVAQQHLKRRPSRRLPSPTAAATAQSPQQRAPEVEMIDLTTPEPKDAQQQQQQQQEDGLISSCAFHADATAQRVGEIAAASEEYGVVTAAPVTSTAAAAAAASAAAQSDVAAAAAMQGPRMVVGRAAAAAGAAQAELKAVDVGEALAVAAAAAASAEAEAAAAAACTAETRVVQEQQTAGADAVPAAATERAAAAAAAAAHVQLAAVAAVAGSDNVAPAAVAAKAAPNGLAAAAAAAAAPGQHNSASSEPHVLEAAADAPVAAVQVRRGNTDINVALAPAITAAAAAEEAETGPAPAALTAAETTAPGSTVDATAASMAAAAVGERAGSTDIEVPEHTAADAAAPVSACAAAAAAEAPCSKSIHSQVQHAPAAAAAEAAVAAAAAAEREAPRTDTITAAAAATTTTAAAAAATADGVDDRQLSYPNTEQMRHLSGCVPDALLPPLSPGEMRALGQTMHPDVAARFIKGQDAFWQWLAININTITSPIKQTRTASAAIQAMNERQLMLLHVQLDPPRMQRPVGSTSAWCKQAGIDAGKLQAQLVDLINDALAAEPGRPQNLAGAEQLPPDLPCRFMEQYTIPPEHPLEMLRGQLSVRASQFVPKGTILGPYRGYSCWEHQYKALLLDLVPSHFVSKDKSWDVLLWELLTESYAVQDENMKIPTFDSEQQHTAAAAAACKAGKKRKQQQQAIAADLGDDEGDDLLCSAFGYGNVTALVNDPSVDPLTACQNKKAFAKRELITGSGPNVVIRLMWVRSWPFLFMITTKDVAAGEDFWYDYEYGYWDIMSTTLKRVKQATGKDPREAFAAAFEAAHGQGRNITTQALSAPQLSGASAARHLAEAAQGLPPQQSTAAVEAAAVAEAEAAAGDGGGALLDTAAAAACGKATDGLGGEDSTSKGVTTEQDSAPATVVVDADVATGAALQKCTEADGGADDVSGHVVMSSQQKQQQKSFTADATAKLAVHNSSKSSSPHERKQEVVGAGRTDSSSKRADMPSNRGDQRVRVPSGSDRQLSSPDMSGRLALDSLDSMKQHQSRRQRSAENRREARTSGRSRSRSRDRSGRDKPQDRNHSRQEQRDKQGQRNGSSSNRRDRRDNNGMKPEVADAGGASNAAAEIAGTKRGRFLTLPSSNPNANKQQHQRTHDDRGRSHSQRRSRSRSRDRHTTTATPVAAKRSPRAWAVGDRSARHRSRSRSRGRARGGSRERAPARHTGVQQGSSADRATVAFAGACRLGGTSKMPYALERGYISRHNPPPEFPLDRYPPPPVAGATGLGAADRFPPPPPVVGQDRPHGYTAGPWHGSATTIVDDTQAASGPACSTVQRDGPAITAPPIARQNQAPSTTAAAAVGGDSLWRKKSSEAAHIAGFSGATTADGSSLWRSKRPQVTDGTAAVAAETTTTAPIIQRGKVPAATWGTVPASAAPVPHHPQSATGNPVIVAAASGGLWRQHEQHSAATPVGTRCNAGPAVCDAGSEVPIFTWRTVGKLISDGPEAAAAAAQRVTDTAGAAKPGQQSVVGFILSRGETEVQPGSQQQQQLSGGVAAVMHEQSWQQQPPPHAPLRQQLQSGTRSNPSPAVDLFWSSNIYSVAAQQAATAAPSTQSPAAAAGGGCAGTAAPEAPAARIPKGVEILSRKAAKAAASAEVAGTSGHVTAPPLAAATAPPPAPGTSSIPSQAAAPTCSGAPNGPGLFGGALHPIDLVSSPTAVGAPAGAAAAATMAIVPAGGRMIIYSDDEPDSDTDSG